MSEEPEGIKEVLSVDYHMGQKEYHADLYQQMGVGRQISHEDYENPLLTLELMAPLGYLIAHWSLVANMAQEQLLHVQLEFDIWYAKVAGEVRPLVVEQYGKTGSSEGAIKQAIIAGYPATYRKWMEEINKYKTGLNQAKVICESLEKRLSSLQSMAKLQEALLRGGVGEPPTMKDGSVKVGRFRTVQD